MRPKTINDGHRDRIYDIAGAMPSAGRGGGGPGASARVGRVDAALRNG
jgi:hypothetical protein